MPTLITLSISLTLRSAVISSPAPYCEFLFVTAHILGSFYSSPPPTLILLLQLDIRYSTHWICLYYRWYLYSFWMFAFALLTYSTFANKFFGIFATRLCRIGKTLAANYFRSLRTMLSQWSQSGDWRESASNFEEFLKKPLQWIEIKCNFFLRKNSECFSFSNFNKLFKFLSPLFRFLLPAID